MLKTKAATVVSAYVSSSNDLTTATWSAGTDSPTFPSSHALNSADQRQLGALGFANGATDVAHVSVGISGGGTSGATSNLVEHIRATFTGASSITWDSWAEFNSANGSAGPAVVGNVLGVSSDGHIHETSLCLSADFANGYPTSRLSTNADTSSSWTTGFGAVANPDSQANFIATYALAKLASAAMLVVYGNGGVAQPNTTGLRSNKYSSGATWPTTSSVVTGNGTTSQDQNDWCLCGVDTAHVFCVRRSGSNTFDMQMYDGTNWGSKTAPPNQNHKAGSGLFAAPLADATAFYLFLLDSTGNQAVQYCKYTVAGDSWGSWTQLEAAGSTARNYVSGYPAVGNNQIGVVFTAVNGSNFDILVSALSLTAAVAKVFVPGVVFAVM